MRLWATLLGLGCFSALLWPSRAGNTVADTGSDLLSDNVLVDADDGDDDGGFCPDSLF
ncbi:unnamed protein product, partial [Ixodes persulcatus]